MLCNLSCSGCPFPSQGGPLSSFWESLLFGRTHMNGQISHYCPVLLHGPSSSAGFLTQQPLSAGRVFWSEIGLVPGQRTVIKKAPSLRLQSTLNQSPSTPHSCQEFFPFGDSFLQLPGSSNLLTKQSASPMVDILVFSKGGQYMNNISLYALVAAAVLLHCSF